MRTHSNEFKEAIKKSGRQLDNIITIGEEKITSEDINSVNLITEGNILKSVMKELDVNCNTSIEVGTEFNFKLGVLVGNSYEYINYGTFIVQKNEYNADTKSYDLVCYDKMLYAMKDYEEITVTNPTLKYYIYLIAQKIGLNFPQLSGGFANDRKLIGPDKYKGLGYTYRDVLDEIAQITGSTICINSNDELEVRYITNTEDVIDEEYIKDTNVTFGKKYGPINALVFSRSADSDTIYRRNETSISENGLCEIKISDNQFINGNDRDQYIDELFNRLNGLEYYINDFTSTGVCYYDLCDRYNVKIGNDYYSCVLLNDEIDVTQGLEEQIYTELPDVTETDYSKSDKTDNKINQTYLIVDKQNQTIEGVVSQIGEQDEKIAQISLSVDELNSKIQEVADITTTQETSYATLNFTDINESEPIYVRIRPINENISYLYPNSGLYPSNNLYPKIRILRFTNTTDNTYIDYELPDDLLYYDENFYDEFILDYENQECKKIRRCYYKNDGSVGIVLQSTINYDYPKLQLSDGNYTVSLLGYTNGYLNVRLMASNIYTSQFATKVELESELKQTSNEISLSVDKKIEGVDKTIEDNYTTLNSKIDLTAENITSSVSEKYATKTELGTQYTTLHSEIEQTSSSITSTVSQTYATKSALNTTNSNVSTLSSQIKQTATSIDLTTSDNGTSAGINIKLRNADGTQLDEKTANITMNGLVKFTDLSNAGSTTINGANITTGTISANLVKGGTLTGTTISGNTINLYSSNAMNVYGSDGKLDVKVANDGVGFYDNSGTYSGKVTSINNGSTRGVSLGTYSGNRMNLYKDASGNEIAYFTASSGLYGYGFTKASLEELKKNIKPYEEKALDKVVDSEIYTYNYKTEDDNEKLNIGFVIGKDYKTPEEVLNKSNNGIDIFNMCSILWKAVQEQQKEIEELKEVLMKESDK